MIAILTSGVELGVHGTGLLLQRRLAERGLASTVDVLERYMEGTDGSAGTPSPVPPVGGPDALTLLPTRRPPQPELARRQRRRHDELVPEAARAAVLSTWTERQVDHLVVMTGFWLPLVEQYVAESRLPVSVDRCRLDAVDPPSFLPYLRHATYRREIRLLSPETSSLPWTIPVTGREPLPWAEREHRLVVLAGGHRDALRALERSGLSIDLVHSRTGATAVADALSTALSRALPAGTRTFGNDPAWHAWTDDDFAPLQPSGPDESAVLAAGWRSRGDGQSHPSLHLTRHARALLTRPTAAALQDALWAGTPAILLESALEHEERNADLWVALGLGVRWPTWRESGFSGEVLQTLHHRTVRVRGQVPDYADRLALDVLRSSRSATNGLARPLRAMG